MAIQRFCLLVWIRALRIVRGQSYLRHRLPMVLLTTGRVFPRRADQLLARDMDVFLVLQNEHPVSFRDANTLGAGEDHHALAGLAGPHNDVFGRAEPDSTVFPIGDEILAGERLVVLPSV